MINKTIKIDIDDSPFIFDEKRWEGGSSSEKFSAWAMGNDDLQNMMAEYENIKRKSQILSEAILEKKIVIVRGYAGHDSVREIEPVNFVSHGESIWCYDSTHKSCIQLKIVRIGDLELTDRYWEHESEHTIGKTDIFRWSGDAQIRIRMDMASIVKRDLTERFKDAAVLPKSQLYLLRDGVWRLDTYVTTLNPVARFYAGWIDKITIIDTPELQEEFDRYIAESTTAVFLRERYSDKEQRAILSLMYDVMVADNEINIFEKRFLNKYFSTFEVSFFDFAYLPREESTKIAKSMNENQKKELIDVLTAMAESDFILKVEEKKAIADVKEIILCQN